MEKQVLIAAVIVASIAVAAGLHFSVLKKDEKTVENAEPDWKQNVSDEETEVATLAGGCFWCIEAIFDERKGVEKAVSGYAGGSKENATYKQVKTGETDHREAVQVHYYPSIISYEKILNEYWRNIDPTDAGGQFSDRGPQYTTAIYYHDEDQKEVAEKTRDNISDKFDEPIATEIEEFTTFYRAEDYHQNYSQKNTIQYKAYKKASGRSGFIQRVWDKVK